MTINSAATCKNIHEQNVGVMSSPKTSEIMTRLNGSVGSMPSYLLSVLVNWQQRSTERANLSTMSPHLLKDMGISQEHVAREVDKAFWQA